MKDLSKVDQEEKEFFEENKTPCLDTPIELKPGQGAVVPVGVYKISAPRPRFNVTSTPNIGDDLGGSFSEIPHSNGEQCLMFCMMINYNSKPCAVTIHPVDLSTGVR